MIAVTGNALLYLTETTINSYSARGRNVNIISYTLTVAKHRSWMTSVTTLNCYCKAFLKLQNNICKKAVVSFRCCRDHEDRNFLLMPNWLLVMYA